MIFKGFKFRRNKSIVVLNETKGSALLFGKVSDDNHPGVVETDYTVNEKKVYAIPIGCSGHSLTNMMKGTDGRLYLCHDAKCYIASKAELEKRRAMVRAQKEEEK